MTADTRYALVTGARTAREAEAYLPGNYRLLRETQDERSRHVFVIAGEDSHGWTLDGYVIPRYASGLIGCEETRRDDWPVHRPAAPDAPIPGRHHYGGCSPDYPRVRPDGVCEECGERACPACGLGDCDGGCVWADDDRQYAHDEDPQAD